MSSAVTYFTISNTTELPASLVKFSISSFPMLTWLKFAKCSIKQKSTLIRCFTISPYTLWLTFRDAAFSVPGYSEVPYTSSPQSQSLNNCGSKDASSTSPLEKAFSYISLPKVSINRWRRIRKLAGIVHKDVSPFSFASTLFSEFAIVVRFMDNVFFFII